MPSSDPRISDQKSFDLVTREPHQVSGLYYYAVLDCLVDLSYMVANDFFKRPHLYTNLGTFQRFQADASSSPPSVSIAQVLARLHARYGSDEYLLGKMQRQQIFAALFGSAGCHEMNSDSDFARLRNELLYACATFAERVYDTGVDMLRERVLDAHRTFQEYLTGLLGDSIRWSRDGALATLTEEIAYPILRAQGIAAVFGIAKPAKEDWPYVEDANGDKLVEEIAKQLNWSAHVTEMSGNATHRLTRERISNLQRTALRGAEAITMIIDFDERSAANAPDDINRLIIKCYAWGSAMMSLGNHVIPDEPTPSAETMPGIPSQPTFARRINR
jgi:hypothetical protein